MSQLNEDLVDALDAAEGHSSGMFFLIENLKQELAEARQQNVLLREAMNNAMCMMKLEYAAYCVLSKALDSSDDLSGSIL